MSSWAWKSTGTPGLYTLHHNDIEVGTFSVLPGHIRNEGALLDQIVELLYEGEG